MNRLSSIIYFTLTFYGVTLFAAPREYHLSGVRKPVVKINDSSVKYQISAHFFAYDVFTQEKNTALNIRAGKGYCIAGLCKLLKVQQGQELKIQNTLTIEALRKGKLFYYKIDIPKTSVKIISTDTQKKKLAPSQQQGVDKTHYSKSTLKGFKLIGYKGRILDDFSSLWLDYKRMIDNLNFDCTEDEFFESIEQLESEIKKDFEVSQYKQKFNEDASLLSTDIQELMASIKNMGDDLILRLKISVKKKSIDGLEKNLKNFTPKE